MTSSDVDSTLIDAARLGDPSAIERLLVICQPDVRRYARRSCATSVIDDAVQEALLILSRHVNQVRRAAALSGWLFAVVRRECRRLARGALHMDTWEESRLDAWVDGRGNESLRIEIAEAIQSLPPAFREVIVLRDFEELTIGEIALRLDITRAAVKSRLHRARLLTREYLAP
jgi:RNA polymerase sigma factor (sigma-70 family)